MAYEVDQSNKIENSGDTVLALSNGIARSMRLPVKEKQKALDLLKKRRSGSRKFIQIQLFAVALYFLLENLPVPYTVVIDTEYDGHEQDIRSMLLNLIWRDNPDFDPDSITFGRVGKQSHAHKLALEVFRKRVKADRIVKADDLLRKIVGP